MVSETCTIDGFGPLPVVRPTSVADLGELVRRAAGDGQAIYPFGGQTQLGLGNPPTKPGIAVDMRELDRVIDFPARDMTVTVQAGITIAKLQALLAPENLRLPIDVPQPEKATLAGILATNVSGPRRLGYGTLRDYVIGISAVNNEGHEFKAGGRVVKNVAGYDLCKLLVGSLGTLGIITQVTLKLRPLAEEAALVTLASYEQGLAALLDQLYATRTRPVCLELLNRRSAETIFFAARLTCPDAPWIVVIGFEGNADLVNWQVQQLVKELGAAHSLNVRIGAKAGWLWQSLSEWPAELDGTVVYQACAQPSAVVGLCQLVQSKFPALAVHAHVANGIVRIAGEFMAVETYPAAKRFPPASVAKYFMDAFLDALRDSRGNMSAVRCPHQWKSVVSVWGRPPADLWLMRQVKCQFDPRGVFNPGRFVGGI